MSQNFFNKYPPIIGRESSFAWFTITERLPAIIDRLIEQYRHSPDVIDKLYLLKENVREGHIEYYPSSGPDIKDWEQYIKPYQGMSWFDAPFYFIETYFYRQILDLVNYFDDGIDPFKVQKFNDLHANKNQMVDLWLRIESEFINGKEKILHQLLQVNLWGNKADLSQLKINRDASHRNYNLLDDSTKVVYKLMDSVGRVDIILDNSGLELFTDIMLAIWLLRLNIAQKVVFHSKAYPTFVSDATSEDIFVLHSGLKDAGVDPFIEFFHQYQNNGRIIVESNEFWNAPLHFYEMPSYLHAFLSESDLIFLKGDANYRRVFGDRVINSHIDLEKLTWFLPAKTLAIRMLKSEIMVGLAIKKVRSLSMRDQNWMVSGKYGIIQLLN